MRPRKIEGLGGGRPLGRLSAKARRGWHAKKVRRCAGSASKRPVTFLVRADCLLLPPSRFPDALGLFIITIHSTLCTQRWVPNACLLHRVQAMLLSDCRWWLGASGETQWRGGEWRVDGRWMGDVDKVLPGSTGNY